MLRGSVLDPAFALAWDGAGKKTGNPCTAWAGRARADEFRPAHGGTSGSKPNLVGGGTKSDTLYCEQITIFANG